MKTFVTRCDVVCEPSGFVDVTEEIRGAVTSAGVQAGRATVTSRGADCVIFLNENETGLKSDLRSVFDRLLPRAHAAGAMGSASVVVPIVEGDLWIGDWQRVLAHLDTPGDIVIQVCGT